MLLKYRIGAKFWKLSTTCINLWLASAYRLLAGGALWPPRAWRIFTQFNASSFFNNSKISRMLGDTQLLFLGNSYAILQCNSLFSVVRRMFCGTYPKDWLKRRSSLRSISSKPTNIVVITIVEKVVTVFVDGVPQMICKFLKVCHNILWWNKRKR